MWSPWNGGYFGMNPQVGPANLISVYPNFTWTPKNKLRLTMDVLIYWRYSTEAGIYAPGGSFRLSGSDSKKRYIGTAYIMTLTWNINNFSEL
ncbi:alginate export family protein [Flavitalea antarctica]